MHLVALVRFYPVRNNAPLEFLTGFTLAQTTKFLAPGSATGMQRSQREIIKLHARVGGER